MTDISIISILSEFMQLMEQTFKTLEPNHDILDSYTSVLNEDRIPNLEYHKLARGHVKSFT